MRVNWLRAKARLDRWVEELILVRHEMDWTVQWYAHQKSTWQTRQGNPAHQTFPGHCAYASKQISMWTSLGRQAQTQFESAKQLSVQQLQNAGIEMESLNPGM
jgi:hypothetical protein